MIGRGRLAQLATPSPEQVISRFGKLCTHAGHYRIFELDLSIRSDSPTILSYFKKMYSHFAVPPPQEEVLTYYVIEAPVVSGSPVVVADDRVYVVANPDIFPGFSYMTVFNSFIAKLQEHFLIHSGAMEFKGSGIIIPGAARCGKTTVTLSLIGRGFSLFSDEIAAIHRLDHKVYPFPRGLGMREGVGHALKGIDFEKLETIPMIGGGYKRVLDIGELKGALATEPCPAKFIFFLVPSADEDYSQLASEKILYLITSDVPEMMLAEMGKVDGVELVEVTGDTSEAKFPIIRFRVQSGYPVLAKLEEICYRYNVLIFDTVKGEHAQPDFTGPPQLTPMPYSRAMFELLTRARSGARSALLTNQFKGSVTKMYLALADIVRKTKCYELVVGRLDEMIDLIEETVTRD